MNPISAIIRKELKDALRDRRTLMTALISSLFGVPLILLIFSVVLSQLESQEDKRTVVAVGMQQAPQLENYLLRQGYRIEAAPERYEEKSRSKELTQPVLIVPEDFASRWAYGQKISFEIAYDTSNRQAEFGVRSLRRLLEGFSQETISMNLLMRGISTELLQTIEIRDKYLQKPDERRTSVTEMLPMMLLMAIVIGGMYASIDTTAGERERGSLEPLMMNPLSGWQLAGGKWVAVALVGMGVVVLTVLSFFPTQWLIQNDTLRAEFQFGLKEAIGFLCVLLPLVACIAALQIAVALDCKSYKEAQVRNQIISMFIPFVALIPILFPGREPGWFRWLPVLAQNQMMNQILKGETFPLGPMLIAFTVCAALTLICLVYIARKMRNVVAH